MKLKLLVLALFCTVLTYAQSTVTGTVTDSDNLPLPGVNVNLPGTQYGTVTDIDGKFTLDVPNNPPFKVEFSSIGFLSHSVNISQKKQTVTVRLEEEHSVLDEIVVSASRTPERILESPVTIERMGIREIKNTTAATFYDGLENLKEVHFNTSSMNLKSINTRGFASAANTRFLQLVDGMDSSSPALNCVMGNLIGLNELDVHSVELMPGASSALYGANAFNGILFMNSKSPFTHEGISFYAKYGITSQDVAGDRDYWDFGIRAAKAFTKHFAAKANFTYNRATEWMADDTRSMTGGINDRYLNQNYDGLNTYGDEVTTFLTNVGQVSRTGYKEIDLNSNKLENVKADFSVHVRPFDNDFEIIGSHRVGLGNTVYQGANRYKLENFTLSQTKFEVKNKNFFVRGYMISENAGDSYDMRFAGWNVNRAWKSDTAWFTDYATAFLQSQIGLGLNQDQASVFARNFADYNLTAIEGLGANPLGLIPNGDARYMPGTPEFNQALHDVRQDTDFRTGAKFDDRSRIYHSDLNYNFKDLIEFAEIQLGGSVRRYSLRSNGTIFTDYDGPINYDEYGAYAQVQKKLMDERLKFTGSIRYDKSELFEGQFSPRISFVYSAGEQKNHNIRASFQTGFRNPTTQDLFIGLDLGPFLLIGGAESNLDRYTEDVAVSQVGQTLYGQPATITMSGANGYRPAYTVNSVTRFAQTQNPNDLQIVETGLVKPEQVKAFEVGYKAILENGLAIDINGYYNLYTDFMSTSRVITPYYGAVSADPTDAATQLGYAAIANGDRRVYQVYSNSSTDISSMGFGVGLNKKVNKFDLGLSYNHAQFEFDQEKDPAFVAGFNTPKHRVKGSVGSQELFKNFGFNVNVRWSDSYLWQSNFGDGMIPEVTVLDAQISYAVPAIKSIFKASASNIGGDDYLQVIGAGRIGKQYLLSWIINP